MSYIADMIVQCSPIESKDGAVGRLNAWCAEHGYGQTFKKIDADGAGGHKVFTNEVWAMAGNHFPFRELCRAFPTFGWSLPYYATLTVHVEVDEVIFVTGDGLGHRHREGA